MIDKSKIKILGFDLDGTLYPLTPEINGRVRTRIAAKLLEKKPDLSNEEDARAYFEQRYAELQSGSKVLGEAGYEDPSRIMDECLATADVLDLLNRDQRLTEVIGNLARKYDLFLLTSSPTDLAGKKLMALGVPKEIFRWRGYSDTFKIGEKNNGAAFNYMLSRTGIPAANHAYVGDRLKSDILPAKNLGMQTIAVGSEIPEADTSIPKIYDLERLLS